jgi:hypothetical protein
MQNKKVLISAIVIIILIALAGVYVYQNQLFSQQNQNNSQNEQLNEEIVTDDFSIELPKNWKNTNDAIEGVSVIAMNSDEIINNAAAEEIGFKSYLAISPDALNERTMEDYMQQVKDELQIAIPEISFSEEADIYINDKLTKKLEADIMQENINFKVVVFIVQEDENNVWILSYNTTDNNWDSYREEFYSSANSFILK